MKDIVITSRRIRRERNIYLLCLIIAIIINIIAIITYARPWTEVVTQIGYTVVISLVIYILSCILRGVFHILCRFFRRKK